MYHVVHGMGAFLCVLDLSFTRRLFCMCVRHVTCVCVCVSVCEYVYVIDYADMAIDTV